MKKIISVTIPLKIKPTKYKEITFIFVGQLPTKYSSNSLQKKHPSTDCNILVFL